MSVRTYREDELAQEQWKQNSLIYKGRKDLDLQVLVSWSNLEGFPIMVTDFILL